MTKGLLHIIIVWLLCAQTAYAQTPRFVMLAEPFTHTVTTSPNGALPQKGQTLGTFEILDVSATQSAQGAPAYELLLAAYDTGSFRLPVTFPADTGTAARYVSIRVTAPPEESIRNYTPPKEIVFPEAAESWPLKWPLLITALLALTALAYRLLNRKKTTATPDIPVANGDLLLQQVKTQWMAGELNSLQLGEGLVASLQARLGVRAKKSTRQFITAVKKQNGRLLTADLQTTLQQCDAWRFGKQVATPEGGRNAIAILEQLFAVLQPQKPSEP